MTPEALLAEADAARDAGDWARAARLYAGYLAARPDDAGIHLQLGHAVKEAGDAEAALVHYRRAAALAPGDPEPILQEGHALRRLGRGAEAALRMRHALSLAPQDPALRRELALSRHRLEPAPALAPPPAPPILPPTQLAFDVTDLLDYLREARTPTGIQRVQMGLLGAILDHPAPPAPVLLVAWDPTTCRWWQADEQAFRRALALSRTGAAADDPAWRAATAALCTADAGPDAPILPGATLASLGNAWGVADYFRGLRLLRACLPIRYAAFVHDCVPLGLPEHCLALTVGLYARWFAALALQADMLLANSRATAADIARFGAPLGLAAPVSVIPLAAEPPPSGEAAGQALAALGLEGVEEPFVLFVATLESRKNHRMVFQAWIALARRLGAERVPRLFCVGRPGWQAEAALGLLERSPELRARVRVVSGVSDMALAGLTARCLFTVYNSFHEGWGLPVSESLAAGKPCVVPAHSGLLESGAPGAVFFPPGDLPALVATLARLVSDPAALAEASAGIDRAAATRPWPLAAAEVLAALGRPVPAPPRPPPPIDTALPLGAAPPPPTLAGAWGEALRIGLGWWWQEDWGCWTRDGIATLHLPPALPPGTALRLVLSLRAPPAALALRLRLHGAGDPMEAVLDLAPGERRRLELPATMAAPGLLLEIDAGDGAPLGDRAGRRVGVGVECVALRASA